MLDDSNDIPRVQQLVAILKSHPALQNLEPAKLDLLLQASKLRDSEPIFCNVCWLDKLRKEFEDEENAHEDGTLMICKTCRVRGLQATVALCQTADNDNRRYR